MTTSFYFYMQRYNHPHANDPVSRLANAITADTTFPKHEVSYDVIANYMEMSSLYQNLMLTFDEMWQKYQQTV